MILRNGTALFLCFLIPAATAACGTGPGNPDVITMEDVQNPPTDATGTDDRVSPPTDDGIRPDAVMPPDENPGVCHPVRENLNCDGATSCACDIPTAQDSMGVPCNLYDSTGHYTGLNPMCTNMLVCTPGMNNCSVHLPRGYRPTPALFEDRICNGIWDLQSGEPVGLAAACNRYPNGLLDVYLNGAATSLTRGVVSGLDLWSYAALASSMAFCHHVMRADGMELQVRCYPMGRDPLNPGAPVEERLLSYDRQR